jgi:hypothetical protein
VQLANGAVPRQSGFVKVIRNYGSLHPETWQTVCRRIFLAGRLCQCSEVPERLQPNAKQVAKVWSVGDAYSEQEDSEAIENYKKAASIRQRCSYGFRIPV